MSSHCNRCGALFPSKHTPREHLDHCGIICISCYGKAMRLLDKFMEEKE